MLIDTRNVYCPRFVPSYLILCALERAECEMQMFTQLAHEMDTILESELPCLLMLLKAKKKEKNILQPLFDPVKLDHAMEVSYKCAYIKGTVGRV